MKKALLSWSGGKDSAWALHLLRNDNDVEIIGLVTTLNETYNRVAMHGIRRELIESQAASAGLPLWLVPLPWPCSNQQYQHCMSALIQRALAAGVTVMAFGDLFLADIRRYREDQLRGTGIEPLFPVWGLPTPELAETMIAAGVKARLTCVDPKAVPAALAGREYDRELLRELPAAADPCGERGEFHSFVYAGPMLRREISIRSGEVVTRDGFVFADLLPA